MIQLTPTGWRVEVGLPDGTVVLSPAYPTELEAKEAERGLEMREQVMAWLAAADTTRFSTSVPFEAIEAIHQVLVAHGLIEGPS